MQKLTVLELVKTMHDRQIVFYPSPRVAAFT